MKLVSSTVTVVASCVPVWLALASKTASVLFAVALFSIQSNLSISACVVYLLVVEVSEISSALSTTAQVFVFTESTAQVPHAIGMSQLHKRLFPFTVFILVPETSASCFVSMLF